MALARKLTTKIYEIKAHNGHVTSLDLGETGRVLVTGGHDCNVNLWAIGQEECFMSLTGHNRPIDCVRFAYSDNFVYSTDDTGSIRRWDLNAQQTICSTLHGHMKSVRTLDFNPSGEYIVSGSNDTTVRLWDVRNQNKTIKIYRGHMAHVNSVKFSPDGLWIASAGTEGSIIIWDIRKSKQIMEFIEATPKAAAITCIQFHPFEFLLAVGRFDGTVSIYDLESQKRISRIAENSQFYGHPIRCVTFSENGECLFVGTTAGISVIGWEPDREFDHIQSPWTALGDMKVVNGKLFCGSFEEEIVSIHAFSTSRMIPFYNPSNGPVFRHNTTTRKSFSRGNQKLRLSIGATKPSRVVEENEDSKSPSLDGHSSPNLSLELVDEPTLDIHGSSTTILPPGTTSTQYPLNGYSNANGNINSTLGFDSTYTVVGNLPVRKTASPSYNYASLASSTGYSSLGGSGMMSCMGFEGPSSLKMPGERDTFLYDRMMNAYADEMEYNLNDSNPPIITNYDHTEMVEDFPVNQNLQSNGPTSGVSSGSTNVSHATTSSTYQQSKMTKHKSTSNIQKRSSQQMSLANSRINSTSYQQRSKLSQVSSVSQTDLHKLDDNMLLKKSASSHVVNKSRRNLDAQANLNKENARNKNITVQIITKAPTRSRTSLDLRSASNTSASAAAQRQSHIPISYRPDPSLLTQSNINAKSMSHRNSNGNATIDDSNEIQMLSASHEHVFQELSNRHTTLQLIRNSTRAHDIVGALKQAIKLNGRTIFVDLLGAILEKTSSWNLDLCLLLLPEIYELLQSQHKFHYTRACDTLRVILSNFLPIIQDNIDPWAANGLGVDVTREERQRKCIECQHWLLQIRNLPESTHFGTTLTQLQNMIVNI